jgi:diguanylate cyclase (GGDEF)-like protein
MMAHSKTVVRLRIRLFVVIVAALILSGISAVFTFQMAKTNKTKETLHQIEQLIDAVEYSAAIASYADNSQIAEDVLKGLLRTDTICYVHIQNTGKLDLSLNKDSDSPFCNISVRRNLYSPFLASEKVGYVEVRLNENLIQQSVIEIASTMALPQGLLIIVTAAVFWWIISIYLTRPLLKLSNQIHRIEPGTANRLTVSPKNKNDEIAYLAHDVNAMLDIIEQTLCEEKRLRNFIDDIKRQYQMVFEGARTGIMLMDANRRCFLANPMVGQMLHAVKSNSPFCLVGDWVENYFVNPAEFWTMFNTTIMTGEHCSQDLPIRFDKGKRRSGWLHVLMSRQENSDNKQYTVECLLFDISERRRQEDEARYIADHDGLTGLYNRRAGERLISSEVERCNISSERSGVILLIDLDRFKQINDTWGHEAGDKILIDVANRMKTIVRAEDVVVRLGGDEFIIGLFECQSDAVLKNLLTKLITIIQKPIDFNDGNSDYVGASIGVVRYPDNGKEFTELLSLADIGLYKVKNGGRNGFSIYDSIQNNYETHFLSNLNQD